MEDRVCIIMPVFDEETDIEDIVRKWHEVVSKIGMGSSLFVIDDNSDDNTFQILQGLTDELPLLKPIKRLESSGYEAAINDGYKFILNNPVEYVFEVEGNNLIEPSEFWKLWNNRKNTYISVGYTDNILNLLMGVVPSLLFQFLVWIVTFVNVRQSNTRFRLSKYQVISTYAKVIPEKFELSNVMISVMSKYSCINTKYVRIKSKTRPFIFNTEFFVNFKYIIEQLQIIKKSLKYINKVKKK